MTCRTSYRILCNKSHAPKHVRPRYGVIISDCHTSSGPLSEKDPEYLYDLDFYLLQPTLISIYTVSVRPPRLHSSANYDIWRGNRVTNHTNHFSSGSLIPDQLRLHLPSSILYQSVGKPLTVFPSQPGCFVNCYQGQRTEDLGKIE